MTDDSAVARVKVFCSHRSLDKPVVSAFARRLREDGIDAWYDDWEIKPGDSIIETLDQGLGECEAGLLFLSGTAGSGRYLQAEAEALQMLRIEDGKRIIPIIIDAGAEEFIQAHPFLRMLRRIPIDAYEVIRDALLDVDHRPGLGRALHADLVQARVVVRSHGAGVRTRLTINGQEVADEVVDRLPPQLTLAGIRDASLFEALGDRVGRVLFPGQVGVRLGEIIEGLGVSRTVSLGVVADEGLAQLPLEAARIAGSVLPLARHPGVRMYRVIQHVSGGGDRQPPEPGPGPLKILVAVGTPDEDQTANTPLDREAEIGAILDAVDITVGRGRAEVRVLETANAQTIGEALRSGLASGGFHVLHLSGHGSPSSIELESEDGEAVATTAEDLVAAIQSTGAEVPLVFLSAGSGATSDQGLAVALVRAGVARVVAMQSSVSDRYATALAAAFYDRLAGDAAAAPGRTSLANTAGDALAHARRVAGEALRKQYGDKAGDEWLAATLLVSVDDGPLVDPDLAPVSLYSTEPARSRDGVLPSLGEAGLVGRRKQLRRSIRLLRSGRSVALVGIGGIGKSSVAGRLAERLASEGWIVSTTQGPWRLSDVFSGLQMSLAFSEQKPWAAQHAQLLAQVPDDDSARLRALRLTLARHPVLLVFDNFEDNLTAGGEDVIDPVVGTLVGQLASGGGGRGAVLLTSRYPIPGLDHLLAQELLPPLSLNETRRLFLRLPGLARLDQRETALVTALIGGHPRSLELLNALLGQRRSNRAELASKLGALAQRSGIDPTLPRTLAEGIAATVFLSATDVILGELTDLLSPLEHEALLQTAVSNLPVEVGDLASLLTQADEARDIHDLPNAIDRLVGLTLLTRFENGSVWVHRWMAEALRSTDEDTRHRARADRAGRHRLERDTAGGIALDDAIEAVRNFIDADNWDLAADLGDQICGFLARSSTVAVASLAGEFQRAIPTSHRGHKMLADHEGQALLALGFTEDALARYVSLAEDHERLAASDPDRTDYQRDLSISHLKLGDLMRALGRGDEALARYQASLTIAERLAATEPDRTDYQRDLSISHERLGDLVQALGRSDEALARYQASLTIRERLAASEPDRTDYKRDLSVSHERLGDLMWALGRGDEALARYQASLTIAERLAASEPDRTDYKRDLSVSHERLGDLMWALGRGDEALARYQASLTIRERLAASEPDRTDYKRDLSISHNKLGDLMRALGRGDEALARYQASLTIRERLAASEPDRTDYQRDLSISHLKLGDLMRALGRGDEALARYQASLTIAERLAATEPDRTDYQRDLSISHERLGDLVQALGRGDEALARYQASLTIAERLAASEPDRTDYQRDLSISHNKLGDLVQALGRSDEALTHYQIALHIREHLATSEPDRTDYQRDLSISHNKLGDLMRALGRFDEALTHYRIALHIAERLAASEPDRTDYQRDLSISHNELGDLVQALGRGDEALTHYRIALHIAERLAAAEPDRTDYQRDLSSSHNKLGDLMRALGRGDEALTHYRIALLVLDRLATAEPLRDEYELAVTHQRIGDLMIALDRGDEGRTHYQLSLRIAERLANREPQRLEYQRNRLVLRLANHIVRRSLQTDHEADALLTEEYAEAVQVAANIQPETLKSLILALQIGGQKVSKLDRDRAIDLFSEAKSLAEALSASHPANSTYAVSVAMSLRLLAPLQPDPARTTTLIDARRLLTQHRQTLPASGEALISELESAIGPE